MVANDQNNRNANALAQALANERAGQKAEQIQHQQPIPQNLPPNTDKTLQPINPLNPNGSSFGDRPFGTQAQRNAQIGNSIYSDLINSGLTPGSPVFNQQLDRRLGGNNLQLNPDNRSAPISIADKSNIVGSEIRGLLGGFGQGPQAQPQPAPSLLISGENPDAKLQPTDKNFDSYFGVDVSNVSGISTGLTSGKNVSQSQLDQAAKEAAAKAEYQNGPNYFGSGFVAQGPEAGKKAIPNPSGGFSFVPNTKGPTTPNIFGISPTVTPPKNVSQSVAPVQQSNIPFLDVSGLDSKTINGVNDFVTKAASQRGVTDIKLSINGTEKSYPLNSAIGGIITDLNSFSKSNPNQKINIGLSATGLATQTIRPPKDQTQKERSDLLNYISGAQGKQITIKDQNGNVIGTTSGQRSRFDIIKAGANQPISLEFSNVLSSKPPFDAKTGQPLKTLGEYTDKQLLAKGISQNEINNIRNPSFFTEFQKGGFAQQENIFGPPQNQEKTPINDFFGSIYNSGVAITKGQNPIPIFQQGLESTGKSIAKNPGRFTGSLAEELGFNLATLGTGRAVEGGAELSRIISQKGASQTIARGLQASEKIPLPYNVARLGKSNFDLYEIGTEGRSIQPTSRISEMFGIGGKGEKIPLNTTPKEVNIPPLAKSGEAENPLGFINREKGGEVNIVRSAPTNLSPNKVIVKGEVPPEISYLPKGATTPTTLKFENIGKGFYKANLDTPEKRFAIRQSEKIGQLNRVTDIVGFPKSEVIGNPKTYGFFAQQPENLFVGKFPEFTQPQITGFYETRNIGLTSPTGNLFGPITTESFLSSGSELIPTTGSRGLSRKLTDIGLSAGEENAKPTKQFKSFIGDEFGINGNEKIGAGASGKAKALTAEQKGSIKEYFGLETQPTKQRQDVFGTILTPEQKQQRNQRNNKTELEYQTLQYPQSTKEKNAFSYISGFGSATIQKPAISLIPDLTTNNKQNLKQIETPGLIVTRTPTQGLIQTPKLIPSLFTSQITPQQTKQSESLSYITGQVTQQETPSIFSSTFDLTTPPEVPPPTIPTGNLPLFEFPGFSYSLPKRLPPGKRKYILYGTNPFVVGEFYTPGLAEQSVSSSPSIFTTGETTIRKANRGKILSGYASFTGNVHVVNPRKKPSGVKSIFSPGPTQTRPKGKKGKQPTCYFF